MHDNDNLTIERPTFVTHLECAMEGVHYAADQVHNLSKAGKPLLVRYDLAGVKKALTKDALALGGGAGVTGVIGLGHGWASHAIGVVHRPPSP